MKNLSRSELSRRRLVPSKRSKQQAAHPAEAAEAEGVPNVAEPMSDQEEPEDDECGSLDGSELNVD